MSYMKRITNCTLPNYDTRIIIVPNANVCSEAHLEGTIQIILGIPVVEWYTSSEKTWLSFCAFSISNVFVSDFNVTLKHILSICSKRCVYEAQNNIT